MQQDKYYLQEWSVTKNYLEYSKLHEWNNLYRRSFQNRKDMRHGIYVDIMILHKCPNNMFKQYFIYFILVFDFVGPISKKLGAKTNFQMSF